MPLDYSKPGMKKPGAVHEWTPEEQIEFMRCAQDVVYFAENYVHIVHPVTGRQLIKLHDYQKRMLKNFQANRFNVVLSARQIGKTTCSAIYLLWFAMFNPDKKVAILANKQNTAAKIVSDIKMAYLEMPDFVKPGIEKFDALGITFDTGSAIFASATSEDAIRGHAIALLFLDEFAFVPENVADEFWASNYPTISTGGSCIIVSTPNGTGGLYYDIWRKANLPEGHEAKSAFVPYKVNWWEVPGRDDQWKKETISNIGKVRFAQEYGCVLRENRINVCYNGKKYQVNIGDLYEQGTDLLSTLSEADEIRD